MGETSISGWHQTFSKRIGPMARCHRESNAPTEARNAFAFRGRSIQQGCIGDDEMKKEGCWRCGAYLKYVLKYIFLHFRVVYPYRTASNLYPVQDDVVVLPTNPSVVPRIERW